MAVTMGASRRDRHTFPFLLSHPPVSVPGGYIVRVETKERECWKFLDWRLNPENDSRVHGQPSNAANHGST